MKLRYVEISAGPAADAMAIVVSCLQQLQSLTEGEEALLNNAPEDIQDDCKELVMDCKSLINKLNNQVSVKKTEKTVNKEGKEKDVSEGKGKSKG